MSSRQAIRRSLAASKLLLVWVAIVAYCASAIGVAIPLPAAGQKVSSEPFPCQHHRCGCQSAEQCRRSCCCFSDEQKMAWAQAHGVSARSVLSEHPAAASAKKTGKSCCHRGGCERPKTDTTHDSASWIHLISAAKCQGLATLWITIGVALPPARDEQVAASVLVPRETVALWDSAWSSTSFPPPVPPPRNV
ncbi:MAG: hypothetical protein KF708_21535 [Pirellulales bacterium]|nr:hypothetical protein [Pirellulales bacterium]